MTLTNKIVIGTWPLSGDFGVRSLADIETCITRAMDAGIRSFDTAPNYGLGFAESALGMVLAGEDDVQVFTKCGNVPFVGKDFSPDALEASIGNSLKRLKRDSIEGVFLHNPRTEVEDYEPVIERLEALKANGVVNQIGLSGAKGYDYSAVPEGRLDMFQQDANLLYLKEADGARPRFRTFFARSPLATGMLSGRLSENSTFPPDDHRSGWLKGERLSSIVKRVEAIESVLPDGMSVPSAARRFLMHHPSIDRVICGVGRPEHLGGLIEDASAGPLPEEVINALVALHDRDFDRPAGEAGLGY
ncbi:aldo/keto reductase [Henriciella aquimarina]|uniref:aldo/keto reductase n=1 Tax=Henriciella aquimarina TaxID=545261 RepID=UPI000A071614|nr:aldo/keto reductase [Henriciella aquimarina]